MRDSLSLGITTKTMVAQDIVRGQQRDAAKPGEGHLCLPTLQAHFLLERWRGLKNPSFPLTTAAGEKESRFLLVTVPTRCFHVSLPAAALSACIWKLGERPLERLPAQWALPSWAVSLSQIPAPCRGAECAGWFKKGVRFQLAILWEIPYKPGSPANCRRAEPLPCWKRKGDNDALYLTLKRGVKKTE